jgi:tRNA(Ile)-lysidine synthase
MQVQQIYDSIQSAQPGKIWKSEHYIAAMDRASFIIGSPTAPLPLMVIPECGNYRYAGDTATISIEEKEFNSMSEVSKESSVATLDAEKVAFPLTLRPAKAADRFTPFGMKGYKLVSDYLTDRKRNYFQRQSQLVLEDASGEIVWLVGERVSSKVAITTDTIKCLTIRYYYR